MDCDKFWLNKILRQLIPIRTNLLTMHTWPYRLVGTSPPSSPNRITEKYVKMQPATITLLRRGLDILIILQNIKYLFNNTLGHVTSNYEQSPTKRLWVDLLHQRLEILDVGSTNIISVS